METKKGWSKKKEKQQTSWAYMGATLKNMLCDRVPWLQKNVNIKNKRVKIWKIRIYSQLEAK